MKLLLTKITAGSLAEINEAYKSLGRAGVDPDDVFITPAVEDAGSVEISIEVYLTQEQLDIVREEGASIEVLYSLAKVPDPRTYVSKENRFARELEQIKSRQKQ